MKLLPSDVDLIGTFHMATLLLEAVSHLPILVIVTSVLAACVTVGRSHLGGEGCEIR